MESVFAQGFAALPGLADGAALPAIGGEGVDLSPEGLGQIFGGLCAAAASLNGEPRVFPPRVFAPRPAADFLARVAFPPPPPPKALVYCRPALAAVTHPMHPMRPVRTVAAKPRRRPGRPPSRPRPEPLPIRGVLDRPDVEGRCLEYVHQTPGDFLTLDSLLKKNQMGDVYFEFQRDRAIIAAADAPREQKCPDLRDIRSKIFFVVDATKANSYYVAEFPRRWRLRREVLEPIFHSSDQTLTKITFFAESAFPNFLTIRLDDPHLDKECTHELVLPALDDSEGSVPAGLFSYASETLFASLQPHFPLRFTLSAKSLRKTVADARRHPHVEDVRIVLAPGRCLEFQYFEEGVSSYTERYKSRKRINLKSNVSERERFGVAVRLSELTSATAALSDEVRVYCGSGRNGVLFRVEREQGINLNVFVKALPA